MIKIISDHDYEIINLHFEYLLTKAKILGYPLSVIETRLSYASKITELENGNPNPFLYTNTEDLFSEIFTDSKAIDNQHIEFNWVNKWITQSYFYLINKFDITFELLFAYLPIKEMENLFKLFHEMDNSVLANHLKDLMDKTNPIKLFLLKKKISLKTLSINTGISLSTLSSYSQGTRLVKSMSLENGINISRVLKIKPSSLLINF